jgi:hypothetical protein
VKWQDEGADTALAVIHGEDSRRRQGVGAALGETGRQRSGQGHDRGRRFTVTASSSSARRSRPCTWPLIAFDRGRRRLRSTVAASASAAAVSARSANSPDRSVGYPPCEAPGLSGSTTGSSRSTPSTRFPAGNQAIPWPDTLRPFGRRDDQRRTTSSARTATAVAFSATAQITADTCVLSADQVQSLIHRSGSFRPSDRRGCGRAAARAGNRDRIILGMGAAGLPTRWWRHSRLNANRIMPPTPAKVARAAPPPPLQRQGPELPAAPRA